MLRSSEAERFRRSRAVLVFRTIIVDRAGRLAWCRPVVAEVVEADISGMAILLTSDRTHLQFATSAFHKPTAGLDAMPKSSPRIGQELQAFPTDEFSYVGGQELIWDVHNVVESATLRRLALGEISAALADLNASLAVCADQIPATDSVCTAGPAT